MCVFLPAENRNIEERKICHRVEEREHSLYIVRSLKMCRRVLFLRGLLAGGVLEVILWFS